MNVRLLLKHLLYRTGLLPAFHRLRNRRRLTVVMFHRVLPHTDPRSAAADPVWTVTDTVFQHCLRFFHRHYNVISFEQLRAASHDASLLPDRPLLVTFDDGWADNQEFALRALRHHGLPAVVFVVAGGVDRSEPWDERLRHAFRRGSLSPSDFRALWWTVTGEQTAATFDRTALEALISRLIPLDPEQRDKLLTTLPPAPGQLPPPMLSSSQLKDLSSSGVTIGSHGLTHTPIPLSTQPSRELSQSRVRLEDMLEGTQPDVSSLSFPHGIFDASTIETARRFGYRFFFTSEPCLTSLSSRQPVPNVFGRINISSPDITGPSGRFDPALLALWLFTRDSR